MPWRPLPTLRSAAVPHAHRNRLGPRSPPHELPLAREQNRNPQDDDTQLALAARDGWICFHTANRGRSDYRDSPPEMVARIASDGSRSRWARFGPGGRDSARHGGRDSAHFWRKVGEKWPRGWARFRHTTAPNARIDKRFRASIRQRSKITREPLPEIRATSYVAPPAKGRADVEFREREDAPARAIPKRG